MKNCLQLKRKVEQRVYIIVGGEEIEIIVGHIYENSVSLIFKADKDKVVILREEVLLEEKKK